MGMKHFEQMWLDALDRDRRAMVTAYRMAEDCDQNELDLKAFGSKFWANFPPDVMIEQARLADANADAFFAELKELLVYHKTEVRVLTADGQAHKLHDPNIIDFDVERYEPEAFFEMMMIMPVHEFSTG